MLDTVKYSCSLPLGEQNIDASGLFLLLHASSKTREQLMGSTV